MSSNNFGKCSGCKTYIKSKECIICMICKLRYDLVCANIPIKRFSMMDKEHKTSWKCPECLSKEPKLDNRNTPVRPAPAAAATLSISEPSSSPDSDETVSPSGNVNITSRGNHRQPHKPPMASEPSSKYVTEANLRSILRNEIVKALQVVLEQHVTEKVNTCTSQLCREMERLSAALEKFCARIEEVELRVSSLKKQNICNNNDELTATVAQLQSELNDRYQDLLMNDIELTGIPEDGGESSTHLVTLIGKKIGVNLEERDIVFAKRVGGCFRSDEGAAARPRALVVRLARRSLREQLLRAARVRREADTAGLALQGEPRRFYINERLTKHYRQLFYKAREECRRHQWKYSWTRLGNIFVRREHGERAIKIRTESDLAKVFDNNAVSQQL